MGVVETSQQEPTSMEWSDWRQVCPKLIKKNDVCSLYAMNEMKVLSGRVSVAKSAGEIL